jgi:uncharacterized membrane protein (UPF0127 family)
MRRERISIEPPGTVVCEDCGIARTPLSRMRGLMGRATLEPGEGLLLRPAPSIHTFFMRFAIDVVFVDAEMSVLRVVSNLRPWRAAACRGARAALELPAGEARRRGVVTGRRLRVSEAVA